MYTYLRHEPFFFNNYDDYVQFLYLLLYAILSLENIKKIDFMQFYEVIKIYCNSPCNAGASPACINLK